MLKYLLWRLGLSVVVLFGLSVIVFAVMNLSGDPVLLLLPPDTPAADMQEFRERMGFNDPLPVRYWAFLTQLARMDFGDSIQYRVPALGLVLERMPYTLSLAGLAIFIAVLLGVPAGALAAVKRGKFTDVLVSGVAILGQSTPVFWLAIMAILLFAVRLGWLPASGSGTWRHHILPSATLAVFLLGGIVRVSRTSFLEVLSRQYIRTARSKGLSEGVVVMRHALRNAAIPVVTQIALQARYVIGGSVITESIFSWPGLGRLLVRGVYARDYPIVEAGVFVIAILLIIINTLVDISYTWLNPRVRLSK
ncbi:MAG: ABC transporter permease [Trueperaceae bacterium]|nr:ABC transporter permease [Trueperaceae bacterium]